METLGIINKRTKNIWERRNIESSSAKPWIMSYKSNLIVRKLPDPVQLTKKHMEMWYTREMWVDSA